MVRKLDNLNTNMNNLIEDLEDLKSATDNKLSISELILLINKNTDNKNRRLDAETITSKAVIIKVVENEGFYEIEDVFTKKTFSAIKAASCLLLPSVGDLVLVQRFEDGTAYIMSVLEIEHNATSAKLKLPNETVIEAKNLVFNAENIKTKSDSYTINTGLYSLNSIKSNLVSIKFDLSAIHVKQNSKRIETNAETSVASYVHSTRFISDTEKVKALNINYSAASFAKINGKVMMLNGYDLLKSDGKLMMVG